MAKEKEIAKEAENASRPEAIETKKTEPKAIGTKASRAKAIGTKDGTIKAGKNNTAAESTLVIEIKETTSGAVKRLDGLAFEIVAASAEDAEGQQLNENQTLQLKNVRLKVPNGVIIDLN